MSAINTDMSVDVDTLESSGYPSEEVRRWAYVIHDAITGKWVTIWCRDVRTCKSDFHDCLSVVKAMGLWHRARCSVGRYEIVIGENIRDGGIDFRTPDMDRRRCGDPR